MLHIICTSSSAYTYLTYIHIQEALRNIKYSTADGTPRFERASWNLGRLAAISFLYMLQSPTCCKLLL